MNTQALRDHGSLVGYGVILGIETALTLALSRYPGVIKAAPGLIYLYLLVTALAAITWTLSHAFFATILAMIAQEIWLFTPTGQSSLTFQEAIHLAVFGVIALSLSLVEAGATRTRKRLKWQCEIHKNVARTLQRALLPQLNEIPGCDLAFLYESASRDTNVGGDFLDVFRIDEWHIGLLIGDITGHGTEVAVQSAQFRHMLEIYALQGHGPAECLSALNEILYADNRFTELATVFYAVMDTRSHTLTYASAGHGPALLWRTNPGVIEEINTEGMILGAITGERTSYKDACLQLEAGDVLLMYTDGLTEARCGSELYGEDRLHAAFWSLCQEPAQQAVRKLFASAQEFACHHLTDDTAILWIGRLFKDIIHD